MTINGMKIKGLKKAAGATKFASPYRWWVQISLDMDDGALLTSDHVSSNSWTRYRGNVVHVCTTGTPMTMVQISDCVAWAIADHNDRVAMYA
jgi:hypothetical protein